MPNISYGNPVVQCFRNFPVAKKFMDKRGGGLPRFSVEKILSPSAEFSIGQPFCAVFQKFFGSEKVYG